MEYKNYSIEELLAEHENLLELVENYALMYNFTEEGKRSERCKELLDRYSNQLEELEVELTKRLP